MISDTRLSDLADSANIVDKLIAGRIIHQLRDPALGLVDRKEEHLSLEPRSTVQRRISLEVRPARLRGIAPGVIIDRVPIAMLPKQVYLSLDIADGSGVPASIVTRRENARISLAHLVYFAVSKRPGLPLPSDSLTKVLGDAVGRFPKIFDESLNFRDQLEVIADSVEDPDDQEWLHSASEVDKWPKLFANYRESFLVIPRDWSTYSSAESATFQIIADETQTIAGPPRLRERLVRGPDPSRVVSFRVNEVGRARSDIVRVDAPSGTFLTDAAVHKLGYDEPSNEYRVRASRSRYVFYIRRRSGPSPRAAGITARMWPEPSGFIVPLYLLAYYSAAITFLFLLFRPSSDLQVSFDSEKDAALGLILLLPSLTAVWIFRTDELPVKHALVARWRLRSAVAISMIWIDFSASFLNGSRLGQDVQLAGRTILEYLVSLICLVSFIVCLYIAVHVNRLSRRLKYAWENSTLRELDLAKGKPVRVERVVD